MHFLSTLHLASFLTEESVFPHTNLLHNHTRVIMICFLNMFRIQLIMDIVCGYPAKKRSIRETMKRKGVGADSRMPAEKLFFDDAWNVALPSEKQAAIAVQRRCI